MAFYSTPAGNLPCLDPGPSSRFLSFPDTQFDRSYDSYAEEEVGRGDARCSWDNCDWTRDNLYSCFVHVHQFLVVQQCLHP